MSDRKDHSSENRKRRDPDFIYAEIALERAARKARDRARQAGIGVIVVQDGRLVEEPPDLAERITSQGKGVTQEIQDGDTVY